MDRLHFEVRDVATPTVGALQDRLRHAGPTALVGRLGSGRTWAARKAVGSTPALWLNFGRAEARSATAMCQAAAGFGGQELLRTLVEEGTEAALQALDRQVGGAPLIVDDADQLLRLSGAQQDWADDVPGMFAPADHAWLDWIRRRHGPTVLIGARCALPNIPVLVHRAEERVWPVKLEVAERGWRNWAALAQKFGPRYDLFFLARAVAPLMSASAFNELVESAELDEILVEFGRVFRAGGELMVAALDIVATLAGAPQEVVTKALDLAVPRPPADLDAWLTPRGLSLDQLKRSGLVQVSGPDGGLEGQVFPLAALVDCGAAVELPPHRCARLSEELLSVVNDPQSLRPGDAAIVLSAHELAVRAGREDLAIRTARLHVHGLLRLARALSRERDYLRAWGLYDRVEGMLRGEAVSADGALTLVRSYVLNYRAFNGLRADRLRPAQALLDVEEATELWPSNARWQGHRIELLFSLGRRADALSALHHAEEVVLDHPQRARHLRVLPAVTCLRAGWVRLALELVQLDQQPWGDDDEARLRVAGMLRRLQEGVEVTELEAGVFRLVLNKSVELRIQPLDRRGPWVATLGVLGATQKAQGPISALDGLVAMIAVECERLLRAPTPWLPSLDAERKGTLIGAIDVLNSDIGLHHDTDRWFVGRVAGGTLLLMDGPVGGEVPLGEGAMPDVSRPEVGLWFGRAPVDRGGFPTGPIAELRPAGSGRTAEELRLALRELWAEAP